MHNNEERIKVLIADDEVEFASTLVTRLQLRKFQASMVNSGEAALAAVENDCPDILLLDLRMPDLDGLEVLARLWKNHPHIQVIMLTGHGSTEAGRKGLELGAYDYVMKPVDLKFLVERIESAFADRKQSTLKKI